MLGYNVRPWFWLSLVTAICILFLEFAIGWIGVVIVAFHVFPILAIIAFFAYPIFIIFVVAIFLFSMDFIGRFHVAKIVWIEDLYAFNGLFARTLALADKIGASFEKLGIAPYNVLNAFTYGVFKPKIVVYKKILETFDIDEQNFVIAHELGHIKHKWIWLLYSFANASIFLPLLMPYPFVIILYFVFIPARFALLWFSRECEFLADREAVLATGNIYAAIRALAKLGKIENLQLDIKKLREEVVDKDLYEKAINDFVASLRTHPLIKRRIKELLKVYGYL